VNPIALCDGHGIDFVTVTEQILMAVHIQPTMLSKMSAGHADSIPVIRSSSSAVYFERFQACLRGFVPVVCPTA
jgi:hypothetical protein